MIACLEVQIIVQIVRLMYVGMDMSECFARFQPGGKVFGGDDDTFLRCL